MRRDAGQRYLGVQRGERFRGGPAWQGWLGLLVTGSGEFRARLTQVTLHHLRLTAAEERLPRIGVAAVPPDLILVSLARGSGPEPIWGGVRLGQREIIMLGAGQRLYMRTDGPCRGGTIGLPVSKLARYGSAMIGADFDVPRAAQWRRPRPAMIRHLRHLYSAGIDAIERRSNADRTHPSTGKPRMDWSSN